MIVTITGAVAIVTLGYLLASKYLPPERSPLPNVYTASGTLLIDSGTDSITDRIPSQFAGLIGAANIDLSGGGSNNRELALQLLRSRSVLDAVGEDLSIVERYELDPPVEHRARTIVSEKLDVEADSATGTIEIRFTDTDPQFAARGVRAVMSHLEKRLGDLGVDQNRLKMQLLDEKIAEVDQRIRTLEDRIEQFQRDNRMLSASSVAQQQSQLLGEVRSQLLLTQLEIDYSSAFTSPESPEMRRLMVQRDSYLQLINRLESGEPLPDGLGPAQGDLPALVFEFGRLQRELELQTGIHRSLTEESELVRLAAESQAPVFQILESPEVPQEKSGPSRATTAMIATITAFFLSVFLAFVVEYFHRVAEDPTESPKLEAAKLHVRKLLPFGKKSS